MGAWREIGDDLFSFDDCCQVYAVRHGDQALLIDLGSAAALEHLAELGVSRVAEVWFTHAERDQCQGYPRAAAAGLSLRFPAAARAWVDPATRDDFRRLSPCHLAYPHRPHPPQPMPAARFDLEPGQSLAFGLYDLTIVAAPGHLDHHLAFLAEGPGGPWLFGGDAMAGRGTVHQAYSLEHDHYTGGGARQAAATLCALRNLRPRRLCPAHGPVLDRDLEGAFNLTIDRLRRLADLKDTCQPGRPAVERLARTTPHTFCPVSEHLWLWNNSYFLLSDDGPALVVDVQTPLPDTFHDAWRETFGDRPLEVALVTHIHCDHVMGIESLRARGLRECWAYETLRGAIELPYDYFRPWLHNHPTRVDRVLREGEPVTWREYTLTPYPFPGQTDLHACYATRVDGHDVLFAGDNFYPAQQWGGTGGLCGQNGGHPALWRQSAQRVLQLAPDWILASHRQPFPFRRADFEAVVAWSYTIEALMRELSPDGCLERHHSPHLLEARPYVQPAGPANPVTITVRNPWPRPRTITLQPVLPAGVHGEVTPQTVAIPAGGEALVAFALSAAGLAGMAMVTWDVSVDGEPWGELVECYLRGSGTYLGEEAG